MCVCVCVFIFRSACVYVWNVSENKAAVVNRRWYFVVFRPFVRNSIIPCFASHSARVFSFISRREAPATIVSRWLLLVCVSIDCCVIIVCRTKSRFIVRHTVLNAKYVIYLFIFFFIASSRSHDSNRPSIDLFASRLAPRAFVQCIISHFA